VRAERLLAILLELRADRRVTARDLAARLGVAERTVHRDMEALGAAGVPVVASRGAGGGWFLLEPYRTDLTGLSAAEASALALGAPGALLEDLGLGRAAAAALTKLLAALPAAGRRGAEFARSRLHVDGAGWTRPLEPAEHLLTLQEAVWLERRVEILYAREGAEPSERVVDALGLVARGGVWYLVGAVDGAPRTYRASRVRAARVLPEAAARPEGFDLPAYWNASREAFRAALPAYPTRLLVDAAAFERHPPVNRFARVESLGPPDGFGRREARVTFEVEEDALAYALSLGPRAEVLAPEALRALVLEAARATAERYAAGPAITLT
jgi:predicted DNA-binding transcriptional regulator YafY